MNTIRFPGLADKNEPLQHTRNIISTPNAADTIESIVANIDADLSSLPPVIDSANGPSPSRINIEDIRPCLTEYGSDIL